MITAARETQAAHATIWLRDEEAKASEEKSSGGSLAELPCGLHVDFVQQNVQQQGHTTAGMHDHRQPLQAAGVVRSSCAPIVRIEVVRRRWPLFGRQTTLNVAAYCAPVSSISAGQQRNEQVVDARDTVYGSDVQDRPAASPGVPVWQVLAFRGGHGGTAVERSSAVFAVAVA